MSGSYLWDDDFFRFEQDEFDHDDYADDQYWVDDHDEDLLGGIDDWYAFDAYDEYVDYWDWDEWVEHVLPSHSSIERRGRFEPLCGDHFKYSNAIVRRDRDSERLRSYRLATRKINPILVTRRHIRQHKELQRNAAYA